MRKALSHVLLTAVVAAIVLAVVPSYALNTTDAAGVNANDTIGTAGFIDLSVACPTGRIASPGDDVVFGLTPGAAEPAWPYHWSSGLTTQGVPAGTYAQATVFLSSNGFISFVDPGAGNQYGAGIPNAAAPNGIVAGVWRDLNPGAEASPNGVYWCSSGVSPNRVWYIQFKSVRDFTAGTLCKYNFEFQIFESDSHVDVYYQSNPTCTGFTFRGGEENSTGGTGVQYFSTNNPPDNAGIRYKDVVAPVVSSVTSACGLTGTNGWCRSATNNVTITDNNDGAGNGQGFGVKSRTRTIDGGSSASYTSGVAAGSTLADGIHTIAATATDFGTNVSATLSNSLKIDTGTPGVSLTPSCSVTGDNGWCKSGLSVSATASDSVSGIASAVCTLDGGPVACGTIAIPDGTHSVTISATDAAGNSSATGLSGLTLDGGAPTITGSLTPPANGFGWNNSDTTVSFACADATSGIASCTSPSTITTEGAGQSVPGTAVDNAGNSAVDTEIVNLDLTAPSISGAPTTSPNGNGWYSGDVTVAWTCADDLSGIDACPADSTISGEGTGLTDTQSVSDKAGNSASATSDPEVQIDTTAPTTGIDAPGGWVNGDVTLTLTPADALSGLDATKYQVDGGGFQDGTTILLTDEGEHTIDFYSTDLAGNTESTHTVTVQIDKTAPTITHALDPAANGFGWNKTATTVTFTCGDVLSGLASCTDPSDVTDEGAAQEVIGSASDVAGNTATDTAIVNVDLTAPTITADRSPLGEWVNEPVTVTFTCSDDLSGIDTCSDAVELSGEGAGQSASGDAADTAGNTSSATLGDINIDLTAPEITGTVVETPNGNGWFNGDVTVHWECSDALSGVASCPDDTIVASEGNNLSVFGFVLDNAGNSASAEVTGINIDRTAPTIALDSRLPAANANGWNVSDVTVVWACTDALSGVVSDSSTDVVSGETAGTDAAGSCADLAGNSASDSQGPVKIDGTAPSISASRSPEANANGWANSAVTVSFACDDALSGVESCGAPVVLGEGADQSADGSVTDLAGNTASATVADIDVDLTDPTVTGEIVSGPPSETGWYSGDVTVHWTCSDDLSGVDECPADTVVDGSGGALIASASASDKAGNSGLGHVDGINIDRLDPTITYLGASPAANANGWNNTDVQLSWSCNDDGIVVSPVVTASLTAETVGASATGECEDQAGNMVSDTEGPVRIDKTAPSASIDSPSLLPLVVGPLGGSVTGTASDALSGVSTVTLTVTDVLLGGSHSVLATCTNASCTTWTADPGAIGLGLWTITAVSTDLAGNASLPSLPLLVVVVAV